MAKLSIKQREEKREKLVAKYAKKYAELKGIANDATKSDEERYAARLELQKLPRNVLNCSVNGIAGKLTFLSLSGLQLFR